MVYDHTDASAPIAWLPTKEKTCRKPVRVGKGSAPCEAIEGHTGGCRVFMAARRLMGWKPPCICSQFYGEIFRDWFYCVDCGREWDGLDLPPGREIVGFIHLGAEQPWIQQQRVGVVS